MQLYILGDIDCSDLKESLANKGAETVEDNESRKCTVHGAERCNEVGGGVNVD